MSATALGAVFEPVSPQSTFEETVERLGTAIRLGLLAPGTQMVHVPMGQFARAWEIATAVLFLASDDSTFITATTFLVDGGIAGAYVTPL